MELDWKEFWGGREELVTGAVIGLAFWPFLLWWTVPSTILCSFLWRAGGTKGFDKLMRRLGVPLTLGGFLVLSHALTLLTASLAGVFAFGVLSLGYGIPDSTTGDEGSDIGRFWLKITGNLVAANVLTRATIGCLLGLCFVPLAWSEVWFWFGGWAVLTLGMSAVERCVQ